MGARRNGRSTSNDGGLPWGMGGVIILIMTMSIAASLWFGWQIDKDLGKLKQKQQEFSRETEQNRELTARNDSLLTKESITLKAAVLGLLPPTENQIRKP